MNTRSSRGGRGDRINRVSVFTIRYGWPVSTGREYPWKSSMYLHVLYESMIVWVPQNIIVWETIIYQGLSPWYQGKHNMRYQHTSFLYRGFGTPQWVHPDRIIPQPFTCVHVQCSLEQ